MKNLTFFLIVCIIILAGLSYTFYSLNEKHKNDAVRWEQNAQEIKLNIQQQNLTLKEFKKYMNSKTDSILKIAKIKPKNVTQITNYNTYYVDTTLNVIKPKYEPLNGVYPFIDNTGCFEYSGFIKMLDTVPELNIEERKFFSDFTDIEYMRKDTMHFFWLDWVKWWQKPEITYTIIDNCTGIKRVKKINVK